MVLGLHPHLDMINPRRFQRDCRFFHLNSGLALRTWQTTPPAERWRFFCRALLELQTREDFTSHALVLMGTHFHLLFSTHSLREHILVEDLHQILSRLCNKTWEALELPLFCDPILSAQYYKNAYKYIYRNPIEAGLCRRAEDYEYSSLHSLLGLSSHSAPVIDNMGLVQSPAKTLEWLNQDFGEEQSSLQISNKPNFVFR